MAFFGLSCYFNYISFLIEYLADTIPVPLILHELIKKIQGAFYYIGLTTYRKKKGGEYTMGISDSTEAYATTSNRPTSQYHEQLGNVSPCICPK